MILLGKFEIDIKINAQTSQFYEILHLRPYIIVNISPDKVKGCELLKGEWGKVGSIFDKNYILDGKTLLIKELVEAIDEEKKLITYKVIEGDILKDYKSFKFIIQCIKKDKVSVVRWTFEYETLHGEIIPDSRSLFQLCVDISKDVDAHLTQGNDQELQADVVAVAAVIQI